MLVPILSLDTHKKVSCLINLSSVCDGDLKQADVGTKLVIYGYHGNHIFCTLGKKLFVFSFFHNLKKIK